jgi:hypothetical protein
VGYAGINDFILGSRHSEALSEETGCTMRGDVTERWISRTVGETRELASSNRQGCEQHITNFAFLYRQ